MNEDKVKEGDDQEDDHGDVMMSEGIKKTETKAMRMMAVLTIVAVARDDR
jgi:hypothetical protein